MLLRLLVKKCTSSIICLCRRDCPLRIWRRIDRAVSYLTTMSATGARQWTAVVVALLLLLVAGRCRVVAARENFTVRIGESSVVIKCRLLSTVLWWTGGVLCITRTFRIKPVALSESSEDPSVVPAAQRLTSGNPPNGDPKLRERRYHYKGSRYVTVGQLGLRLELGLGTLTLT